MLLINNKIFFCRKTDVFTKETFEPKTKQSEEFKQKAENLLSENGIIHGLNRWMLFYFLWFLIPVLIAIKIGNGLLAIFYNSGPNSERNARNIMPKILLLIINVLSGVWWYLTYSGKVLPAFSNYYKVCSVLYDIQSAAEHGRFYCFKKECEKEIEAYEGDPIFVETLIFLSVSFGLATFLMFIYMEEISFSVFIKMTGCCVVSIIFSFLIIWTGNPTAFVAEYLKVQRESVAKVEESKSEIDEKSLVQEESKSKIDEKSPVQEESKSEIDEKSLVQEESKSKIDEKSPVQEESKSEIDEKSLVQEENQSEINQEQKELVNFPNPLNE